MECEGVASGGGLQRLCRQFPIRLLREVGIRGQAQRKAIKEFATAVEQSGHWLWLKCKDATWPAK